MRKVDDRIRCALRRAAERYGSVLALSRRLNVSHSTVLFWLNGRIRNISTDLWRLKVFPILEEDLCFLSEKEMSRGEVRNFYLDEREPASGRKIVQVPLVREQDLFSYRVQLENIGSFVKRKASRGVSLEVSCFPAPVYCSVYLEHLMECRNLPWNTLVIFTERSRIADQELLLLRIRGEDFLRICRFHSSKGKLFFEDVISRRMVLCDRETGGEELLRLLWAFPVAAIRFSCRDGKYFNTPLCL